MRPDAVESLRAIQGALNEALLPELQTPFAQEAAQAAAWLAESLAAELDTVVENLAQDNQVLRRILTDGQVQLAAAGGNIPASAAVNETESALAQTGSGSLKISDLTAENRSLMAALAVMLEQLEDMRGDPGDKTELRTEAYRHLRQVAVRGWSFFDVSGFRERIVRARADVE